MQEVRWKLMDRLAKPDCPSSIAPLAFCAENLLAAIPERAVISFGEAVHSCFRVGPSAKGEQHLSRRHAAKVPRQETNVGFLWRLQLIKLHCPLSLPRLFRPLRACLGWIIATSPRLRQSD